jgi:peptidoglycan/xylan/chitin deacetylase (PgdA/CDA1 family)
MIGAAAGIHPVGSAPSAAVANAGAPSAVYVPVLMYHYIRVNPVATDSLGFHLSVTPEHFSLQMALLKQSGFHPITMDAVMARLTGGPALPARPVVLTFDDGYADFATTATPILRSLGFVGTDYVIPGFIGRANYMSLEQLQTVVRDGMWIGGHTMFHVDLARLSMDAQRQTIAQSRQMLRSWTGQPVESFAYPYGSYSAVTPGLVAEAGFTNALTTRDGRRLDVGARFVLPRVRVDGADNLQSLANKLGIALPTPSDTAFWTDLRGTAEAARHGGIVGLLPASDSGGYALIDRDGRVHEFGDFEDHGSLLGQYVNRPVVGAALSPGGHGYWLVGADGGIFPFGDAGGYGSTGGLRLNRPILGMAATPDGGGYWLVAGDGGVFPFGDAVGYGSIGGMRLNQPVVGMAATPDGAGYWLVAADGGVFPFGDAVGYGSTGGTHLNSPIAGMAATPSGLGYWVVAGDGGVFPFGDAVGYGSTGGIHLNSPITAMATTASANGYWLVARDGGVFPFGAALGMGSAA